MTDLGNDGVFDERDEAIARAEAAEWLAGLTPQERSFVRACAAAPRDYLGLLQFADWLQDEQGRDADGMAIRRLCPDKGDVLVVTYPAKEEASWRAKRLAESILRELVKLGRKLVPVILPEGWSAETLDPAQLREAGWVRMSDVENWLHETHALGDSMAEDLHELLVGKYFYPGADG